MSCQCFQIGGPFVAEDPDCPAHGIEAQKEERELCAKLCEDLRWPAWVESTTDAREAMAEAIRGDAP